MYTSRQYRAELRPWRIPGQGEIESFPPEVRRDYAIQVARAMRGFGEEHRTFRAVRADSGAVATEPHRLSTPLYAFLTGAEWLPVTRPGGQLRFVKPVAAWHFDADEDRPPRFLDFVVHQVAVAIDRTALEWLQERAQLGLFNDERHAGRAVLALAEAASTRISDIRDVRRFQELFRRLWVSARQDGSPKSAGWVPVVVDGEIGAVSEAGEEFTLAYFDDERDGLKKQLLEEVGEPIFDFVRGDQAAAWDWVNASAPGRFRRISDDPAEVYVDGSKFDDDTPSRLLSDIVGPWIIDFLVCVAEHKSSAFVQSTQNTLGRIRRAAMGLALVSGEQIQIAHGVERVALPPSLRGALALHRPAGPVLIIQTPGGPPTLDLLAAAAGQLAASLGSRELAHGLDAALLRLAAAMRDRVGDAPDDTMMAAALGVDPESIRLTRRLASGDLIGMLDLAIPLSACVGQSELTSRLQELATQDDPPEEDLRAALEGLAAGMGTPLGELEERMMHLVDLADLKAEFALPIAQLNAAIAVLGGRFKPVSNEHLHRDAWTRHLRQRQPTTAERLRARAAGTFDRREPLTAYTSARDQALTLAPDPAWFTAYDDLPEVVMDARIHEWIEERLPADCSQAALTQTLSEIRASNGARLRDFWNRFSAVLSAWVRAPGTTTTAEVRQAWSNPEGARETCIARARDCGWLDFRALDEQQVAGWLTADGVWPAGRTTDPDVAAWGLSPGSLTSSEERARAERVEQQRRRTQVEFAGATLSALKGGHADIAAAVAATIGHASLYRTSLRATRNARDDGPRQIEWRHGRRLRQGTAEAAGKRHVRRPEAGGRLDWRALGARVATTSPRPRVGRRKHLGVPLP